MLYEKITQLLIFDHTTGMEVLSIAISQPAFQPLFHEDDQ